MLDNASQGFSKTASPNHTSLPGLCALTDASCNAPCLCDTHCDHVILQLLEGPAAVVGTAAVGAVERRCGRAAVACFKCVLGAIAAETGGTNPHQPLFLSLGQVKVGWAYIPGLKSPSKTLHEAQHH